MASADHSLASEMFSGPEPWQQGPDCIIHPQNSKSSRASAITQHRRPCFLHSDCTSFPSLPSLPSPNISSELPKSVCNQEASLYFQVLPKHFFCLFLALSQSSASLLGRLPKLGCFSLLTHESQGSPLPILKHFPFPKIPRIFQMTIDYMITSCFSSKWSSAFFSIIRDSSA